MHNLAHVRLEKLGRELDMHQRLRVVCNLLLFAFFVLFVIRLSGWAYGEAGSNWFVPTCTVFLLLYLLTSGMMANINFENIEKAKDVLQGLMTENRLQADLLELLKPMMADAFRLEPGLIKPMLVERLLESTVKELKDDSSATVGNFLQRQPEAVKDLVRIRCLALLRSREDEIAERLRTARQASNLVHCHEIEILTNAMTEMHKVLTLMANQLPEEQIPIRT